MPAYGSRAVGLKWSSLHCYKTLLWPIHTQNSGSAGHSSRIIIPVKIEPEASRPSIGWHSNPNPIRLHCNSSLYQSTGVAVQQSTGKVSRPVFKFPIKNISPDSDGKMKWTVGHCNSNILQQSIAGWTCLFSALDLQMTDPKSTWGNNRLWMDPCYKFKFADCHFLMHNLPKGVYYCNWVVEQGRERILSRSWTSALRKDICWNMTWFRSQISRRHFTEFGVISSKIHSQLRPLVPP